MQFPVDRRTFLSTTVVGAFSIVPRHVLGGPGYVAPSEKIALAHIGMGTQGFAELGHLLSNPAVQIVAVCDPNRDSQDYVEWGKNSVRNQIRGYLGNPSWREGIEGCPGGRDVGREVVEAYYAQHRGDSSYRGCRAYADFRQLLEEVTDLDAVKIMTPDHLHATIAIAAMKRGKHVLMHKPIANRLWEGRLVLETARQTGCATHLLAYGSGTENAMIARQVRAGVIGTLREIHNWTNRPVWPQYTAIPTDRPPVPPGLDWELWLGPAVDRPYHPHYTHTVFRGWYDFGGGSMADMGIYSLWPVFDVLELDVPVTANAWATHTCEIVNQVSRTSVNDFSYPTACTLRFHFDQRGERAPLDLFWYDGGMKPRLPALLEALDYRMGAEGTMFVGDEGVIVADFLGERPEHITPEKREPLARPTAASSDAPRDSRSPLDAWLDAVRGGEPSPGSFLNAGGITDTVNLGTVALRAGAKIAFDSARMEVTNAAAANTYLRREYRPGWEL